MRSPSYADARLLWILSSFLEQSPGQIRSERTLSELGADSFDMVELQALIEEGFGIQFPTPLTTDLDFDRLLTLVLRHCATLHG